MHVAETKESGISLKESDMKKLKKKCEKLVRYSGSFMDSTAIAANNCITDLAIYDPFIRKLLREFLYSYNPDAPARIGRGQNSMVSDSDPLLTSSRKALISVAEVEFQKLWSNFYVAISSGGDITVDDDIDDTRWAAYVDLFRSDLQCLLEKNPPLSFLSVRHMVHALQMVTNMFETIDVSVSICWIKRRELLACVLGSVLRRTFLFIDQAIPTFDMDWDCVDELWRCAFRMYGLLDSFANWSP